MDTNPKFTKVMEKEGDQAPATDLNAWQIKTPKLATPDEPEITDRDISQAVFNGTPVRLEVISKSLFHDINAKLVLDLEIKVSTKTQNDIAHTHITLEKLNGAWIGHEKVENFNHKELKGLGRFLWGRSLSFMQNLANESGAPVNHWVVRMPSEGLTGAKWNELFLPLLKQYGYEVSGSNDWIKTYFPE